MSEEEKENLTGNPKDSENPSKKIKQRSLATNIGSPGARRDDSQDLEGQVLKLMEEQEPSGPSR